MPSSYQHASGDAIPSYPNIEVRIGENPARFLCTDLNPWPVIRGIDEFERASAWLAVARSEDCDDEVVEALEAIADRLREGSGE